MPSSEPLKLSVSEFIAFANQTLEYAYPSVVIQGELANFRVSKNKWVYFDLKDDESSLKFFATVYQLNGPLEDGMLLEVRGTPRLHNLYGFSVTVQQIALVGEGTIKRASKLLETKLAQEGLFDPIRKRALPYPPERIGLITSAESAAYADFKKIINARWSGLDITLRDVQVQGANAPQQIVNAIQAFNQQPEQPEVLVVTRGGGSAEDLQAFNAESVVRTVASSRIPTIVAVGHEIDTSLAELAADVRASTPSNAAELLVPDKTQVLAGLTQVRRMLDRLLGDTVGTRRERLRVISQALQQQTWSTLDAATIRLRHQQDILRAYNPQSALTRGYAYVSADQKIITSGKQFKPGAIVNITLSDAVITAEVKKVEER